MEIRPWDDAHRPLTRSLLRPHRVIRKDSYFEITILIGNEPVPVETVGVLKGVNSPLVPIEYIDTVLAPAVVT